MLALIVLGSLTPPLFALAGALFRAVLLFWPTMILLGAVHSHIAWVPNLSWQATFLVVALLGLLIPTSTSTSTSNN